MSFRSGSSNEGSDGRPHDRPSSATVGTQHQLNHWIIESLKCFNNLVCPGLNPIQRTKPKRVRHCSRFGLLGIVTSKKSTRALFVLEWCMTCTGKWTKPLLAQQNHGMWTMVEVLAASADGKRHPDGVGGLVRLVPIISRCSKSTKGIWQPLGSSMFLHVIDCTLDSTEKFTYNTVLRHLRQQFHPNTSYINDTTLFCFES